ncbi:MAG: phosphopantothenoylcysteine decarboxylase/phosphopantothenate--cysteine ligase [Verrucomicrobiales bacterium]
MKILITAGPTREAIDPVRYLSNRSSGKMGYAIASEAVRAGHEVTLITGPVSLLPPDNLKVVEIESAQQLFEAVEENIAAVDVAIMTAAVADYRPIHVADEKIKKTDCSMTLELECTPDTLGSARSVFEFSGLLVGFAAETTNVAINARAKLDRKGCDMIVANDVSQPGIGFDSDHNAVTIFFSDEGSTVIPKASKQAIANELVRIIAEEWKARIEQ